MPADGFHEADQYEGVVWITRRERVCATAVVCEHIKCEIVTFVSGGLFYNIADIIAGFRGQYSVTCLIVFVITVDRRRQKEIDTKN